MMPKKSFDRMATLHLNCGSDIDEKMHSMSNLLHVTFNETMFVEESSEITEINNPWPGINGGKPFLRQRINFPDW